MLQQFHIQPIASSSIDLELEARVREQREKERKRLEAVRQSLNRSGSNGSSRSHAAISAPSSTSTVDSSIFSWDALNPSQRSSSRPPGPKPSVVKSETITLDDDESGASKRLAVEHTEPACAMDVESGQGVDTVLAPGGTAELDSVELAGAAPAQTVADPLMAADYLEAAGDSEAAAIPLVTGDNVSSVDAQSNGAAGAGADDNEGRELSAFELGEYRS